MPEPHSAPDSVHAGGATAGDPSGSHGSVSASAHSSIVAADEPTRVSGEGESSASSPSTVQRPATDGPCIEGYLIDEEIHRGGQGIVYRATQIGTKRRVALKVLLEGPFAGETARRRFEREIELAASLHHPNIVTILDSGTSFGRYFFAMEYIDGLRLDRYMAQVRPGLRETLQMFVKVCSAVNFAHQRGVIHRDLKPSNILVDAQGEPHVLDFGLAKHARDTDGDQTTVQMLSQTGQILGTVAYMSPEQARGSHDVDVRTDVYSLGVLYYEAMLGRPPYTVSGPLGEILQRIAVDEPLRPRSVRTHTRLGAEINDELETILLKALEKDPSRRYQTAGDLGRDLQHLLAGEPIEAKRASGLYMFRKMLKRYKLQAAVGGAALLMLFGFLVAFAILYASERDARQRAELLETQAAQKAEIARRAAEGERQARFEAEKSTHAAIEAQRELRRALVQQRIERGNLARARGALVEARESFWQAYEENAGPAALWALRQYYLETGDNGAQLLAVERNGPIALSHAARFAAVCETPRGITVRDVEAGRVVHWVRTPGPVSAVSIDESGNLAAAGAGWARAWRHGELRPFVAVDLPPDVDPLAVYAAHGGRWLVLVGERFVATYSATDGKQAGRVVLRSGAIASPDFTHVHDQVAIPTEAGVALINVSEAGALSGSTVWTPRSRPPRAVRFTGDELLAILSEAVYLAAIADIGPDKWLRFLELPESWDFVDLRRGVGAIVLGRRSGQMALYSGDTLVETWSVTQGELQGVWLADEDKSVRTLDATGMLISWIPPSEKEPRRVVYPRPVSSFAAAADGSTVLFATDRDRVALYSPERSNRFMNVAPPRSFRGFAARPGTDGLLLAVSGNGDRAAVGNGSVLKLVELGAGTDPGIERLVQVTGGEVNGRMAEIAMDQDGELIAVHMRSAEGDRQWVEFRRWLTEDVPQRTTVPELPVAAPRIELMGSVIRRIAFISGTSELLVARSNGELTLIDPAQTRSPGSTSAHVPPPRPWRVIDSPPVHVTFDRAGRQLAVACEDGVVRVIAMTTGETLARLRAGANITAVGFDESGESLLVRTNDGRMILFEIRTREPIARWELKRDRGTPLGVWIGDEDSMLVTDTGRVWEFQFRRTDQLIHRSRPQAIERSIANLLADEALFDSWAATAALDEAAPALGESARRSVLEHALRQPGFSIPAEWLPATVDGLSAAMLLQLAHAAYDGDRFDLARTWFEAASQASDGALDANSVRRKADCSYLGEAYGAASAAYAVLPRFPDYRRLESPLDQLKLATALVMQGKTDEARDVVLRMGGEDQPGADLLAMQSSRAIGRYLVGLETETVLTSALRGLLSTFAEESLRYRDDVHFFAGELARSRGDTAQAVAQYQRCIDLARDPWPANWARHRLLQMSRRTPD